ncbi:MAG: hypothetical protein ACRD6X_04510 [Pyrinomonadaceae bacterium]
MKSIVLGAVLLVFGIGVPAYSQGDDPPVRPIIAEVFLARANTEGRVGEPAEQFVVTDVPIFCVVRLHSAGVASIKMDLVAAKVPGVKPESKVVSVAYTTKENEDRVNFSGKPHDVWTAGTYRVDIFIGDKKVRIIEFEIRSSSTETANPSTNKPPARNRKNPKRSTISQTSAL